MSFAYNFVYTTLRQAWQLIFVKPCASHPGHSPVPLSIPRTLYTGEWRCQTTCSCLKNSPAQLQTLATSQSNRLSMEKAGYAMSQKMFGAPSNGAAASGQ